MLTIIDLISQLKAILSNKCSVTEAANWAAEKHLRYENGELKFDENHEQLIFDTLIELIHNEDEPFRLSKEELEEKIRMLETIVMVLGN